MRNAFQPKKIENIVHQNQFIPDHGKIKIVIQYDYFGLADECVVFSIFLANVHTIQLGGYTLDVTQRILSINSMNCDIVISTFIPVKFIERYSKTVSFYLTTTSIIHHLTTYALSF